MSAGCGRFFVTVAARSSSTLGWALALSSKVGSACNIETRTFADRGGSGILAPSFGSRSTSQVLNDMLARRLCYPSAIENMNAPPVISQERCIRPQSRPRATSRFALVWPQHSIKMLRGSDIARAFLRHRGAEVRSEEHTSELQSRRDLVCRLLLEKK